MMRVAVDAMGGDHAPTVAVEGAVVAVREFGIPVTLVGDTSRISAELSQHNTTGLDIILKNATEVVGMHDSASDAVRKKRDSSIRVCFDLVKSGEADAVVSAGNSGATMAAGMFVLKRLNGIERPAIAQVLPNVQGHTTGELHVRAAIEVPTRLNAEQRASLQHFASLCDANVNPITKGFLDKTKKFFGLDPS